MLQLTTHKMKIICRRKVSSSSSSIALKSHDNNLSFCSNYMEKWVSYHDYFSMENLVVKIFTLCIHIFRSWLKFLYFVLFTSLFVGVAK